jgi:hypothetical protein
MSNKTEIVVKNKLSIFEHRFISGDHDPLLEHRFFGASAEHRTLGGVIEHRKMGTMPEHRTVDIEIEHRNLSSEFELNAMVLDQATLKLSKPHVVSSVTVQRRADGSFFLIIEE